jgi:transcriptional regulator
MWSPDYYALKDRSRMLRFMREYPFAVLSLSDANGRMNAVHLPFIYVEARDGSVDLLAHLARANPLHGSFDGQREALVVFSGPHGYVSPFDYESGGQVPTWNYSAVHASGRPQIVRDAGESMRIIADLAQFMEPAKQGWRMEMLDEAKRSGLLQGIVAFRMPIERMQGKLKLNQNKSADDVRAVAAKQREQGNHELADMMLAELDRSNA